MLVDFDIFYAARNSDRIRNDLGANSQVISMAPTTSRPCATVRLQVLPTTQSQHARCLLPFDDRTFVGDVRSSEICHELTSCSGWKSIRSTTMERLGFEGASQRLISGGLIRGDRIQGDLAKPDGAGPYPAVIGLHGCAGMHDTTKQRLADELVAWGYVVLLVDSYATRGIEHACTSSAFVTFLRRRPDAYGALIFLAGQTFVDPHRVAAVGFSAGGWVALSAAEPNSFELFAPPSNLRFRAAAAFNPPCKQAMGRPGIPTLIFIGALDDWTPAADCSNKI